MRSRLHAVAGSLLVALALPASAQAVPTIEPLKPCYVTALQGEEKVGERVMVDAGGFTFNSKVDLTLDGKPVQGGQGLQVGETGLLDLPEFPAPFVPRRVGTRDFTITLTEQGNPANVVSATAKAAALGVDIKPKRARPSQRIRFSGLGFTADKPVYAHYTRKGRQIERVRMVRRTGECGAWSARRPQFPMKDPSQGVWWVQFDQSKKFVDGSVRAPNSVFVRVKFEITLQPR
jgi:hypothetical protein